ncbi:hypothetical protein AX15_003659 [Amanita polypyramis BW_CC]|nr:hypothetical protein AX15_003659 [Amanita polypyramis BW_CC]
MNALRQRLLGQLARRYSTARPFVPPAQLRDPSSSFNSFDAIPKTPPQSPSFYTGRPVYYDQVAQLEKAIAHARSALRSLQLLPLPAFARASLPPLYPVWKNQEEMAVEFQSPMTTTRYRRVTSLLSQLNDYHRIASTAGCADLAQGIYQVVSLFESGKKDAYLARGKRKPVVLDNYGRSYTVGKRKTSSARVWIIPVFNKPQATESMPEQESEETLLGLEPTKESGKVHVTATTILVNNLPLAEYFQLPADRERISRPFKVAGLLGAFNVFAIVRGGGTTGQSGALAHGIAKGLAAHRPDIEPLLKKAKLLRRDPRMVERKKTGLAKARKKYTWVKR